MAKLEDYVNEYVLICNLLEEKKAYRLPYLTDCIAVEKETFEKILQKNNFDDVRNKLKIWKKLRWIDTEKIRNTKIVRINNKSKRMIVVNLKARQVFEKIDYYGKKTNYTNKTS